MGIRSQELASFAMSRTHSSVSVLLADLQEWERLYELRKTRFPTHLKNISTSRPNENSQQSNSHHRSAEKTTTTLDTHKGASDAATESRSSSTPTVRCYNCNGNGHISRDCPKPRKPCTLCKSTSHTRGRCTAAASVASTSHAETYRVECAPRAAERNCFMKDVYFNEVLATCLIDSGSSNVLVRASLADRSNTVVDRICRPLFTVGDTYQPSITTLGEATADITIDGV